MDWDKTILKNWSKVGDGRKVESVDHVQTLWSGYGQILRLTFTDKTSIICKAIDPSGGGEHPRGWQGDVSHRRKIRSYEVEREWYKKFQPLEGALWPQCLVQDEEGDVQFIWLEDLNEKGFIGRHHHLDKKGIEAVLRWLGTFHGFTFGMSPNGLWERGTYWHLQTRPDELRALEDLELKKVAYRLDELLSECPHRSFVHGDAKVANFCFRSDMKEVAAVDFQYIGGGIGIQDLTYFIGSCSEEDSLESLEPWVLDRYFNYFRSALMKFHPEVAGGEVEEAWRKLYDVAWTDFHRFLKGWSPGHWKINTYSERIKSRCIASLGR